VANEKGAQVGGRQHQTYPNEAWRRDRGTTRIWISGSSASIQVLTITVDNGDDPPLRFDAVRPQSMERGGCTSSRKGRTNLKLYYGDPKLAAPVYDYAKFFRERRRSVRAQLGAEDAERGVYRTPGRSSPGRSGTKECFGWPMLLVVAVLTLLAVRG